MYKENFMADNIINAVFGSGICAVTTSAYRANYGMVLRFSGIELPPAFEVDFSNYDVMGRDSITMIGQNNEVQIPDDLWDSGLNIYAYVYLHPTDDSGVTVYTVTIPVLGRPNRTEETPTPHEQSVIEQAISALNAAVEQTAADVETTTANAQAAAQSEANAATSERSAAASAGAALASQNAAESAQQSATESASGATESARNAAQSASTAAESATAAQASAEQAERSVQSISGDAERAERAATTATEKATAASGSAATASAKATEASASATAADQSASSAASSATAAESHATDAKQAKQDAQDAEQAAETAQAAAEQAAESVSGLSEQIAQNTADIAELVLSKAGALIDTASGSIASFTPDATVPTVKGLTVNVEPVQDLHGYDNPWPAGGGKNKLGPLSAASIKALSTSWAWSGNVGTANGLTLELILNTNNEYVDGFRINGTCTAASIVYILRNEASQYAGMILNGIPSGTVSNWEMYYALQTSPYTAWGYDLGNGVTLSDSASGMSVLVLRLKQGKTFNNATIYPMIRPASVTDATFAPYSNICPISGWDEVKVTRTGKNLFSKPYYEDRNIIAGVDVITNDEGHITLNGTATSTFYYNFGTRGSNEKLYKPGTYTLSGGTASSSKFRIVVVKNGQYFTATGNKTTTFTLSEEAEIYFYGTASSGTTFSNETYYPQLELGSTATAYEPYQGDTYQIQLGQTVHGGKIDVVNGVLTVTHGVKVLDGSETWYWSPNNNLAQTVVQNGVVTDGVTQYNSYTQNSTFSDKSWAARSSVDGSIGMFCGASSLYAKYSKFTTAEEAKAFFAENPTTVVYELVTPITIDLTPIEVAVLTGQTNNIWADCGDVSVEYAADLKTYIDNKIAAAVAALS